MVDSVGDDSVLATSDHGSERSCGGCTACCEGWLTDESMKLFPGSGCGHICSEGCGIYESRPEAPCRSFKCAWLMEPEDFPDAMRPDRAGAIPIKDRDWHHWKVLRAFPCGTEVPAETLRWLVDYAKPQQLPVIFYGHHWEGDRYRGMSENALGPPRFAEDVKRMPSDADMFKSMADITRQQA